MQEEKLIIKVMVIFFFCHDLFYTYYLYYLFKSAVGEVWSIYTPPPPFFWLSRPPRHHQTLIPLHLGAFFSSLSLSSSLSPQVCDHEPSVWVWARAHRPDLLPDAVRPQRGTVADELVPLFPFLPFLQQKELLRSLHPAVQPAEPQQQEPGGPRQAEVCVPAAATALVQPMTSCALWSVCAVCASIVCHIPTHDESACGRHSLHRHRNHHNTPSDLVKILSGNGEPSTRTHTHTQSLCAF